MKIKYNKYINKPYNRLEFWLINWDYIELERILDILNARIEKAARQ